MRFWGNAKMEDYGHFERNFSLPLLYTGTSVTYCDTSPLRQPDGQSLQTETSVTYCDTFPLKEPDGQSLQTETSVTYCDTFPLKQPEGPSLPNGDAATPPGRRRGTFTGGQEASACPTGLQPEVIRCFIVVLEDIFTMI
jgi:hypothetical protein